MESQHEPRIIRLRREWAMKPGCRTQETTDERPTWYGLIDPHRWPRWKQWLFRQSGCRICLPPKV